MAIWFFYGKEEFKISQEINNLKSKLLDENFKAMNYRIYHSPDFSELLEICDTSPLMFGNIISVIHCDNYFFKIKNKKIEFSDEQIQSFDYSLKNISESNNIIFVCIIPRNEDKKVDARTKLFKTIAKYSNIKDFPEYREYDKELIKYVSDMVKKKDLIADSKTISYLINYCGVNLRIIDTQLEKIAVTIYPNRQFSKMDIEENCNLQEDVFSLADLIILNDKNALMKQFAQIIDKKNPLEIIGLLNSNLHKLLYLKTYENNKSLQELSNDLKIPEYPIKILLEKIKNKTHTELSILKHDLAEAEIKIKTGTTLNPEYLLESVLLCGGQNV